MPKDDAKTPAADPPRSRYTIQSGPGRELSCGTCDRLFPAFGPIGYADDVAICDRCLFEGDADLGMALALISVTRAYATIADMRPEERLEPLQELGGFAVIYERFAIRSGPPRLFPIPEAMTEDSSPAAGSRVSELPRQE